MKKKDKLDFFVFTTKKNIEKKSKIKIVIHDYEGDWQCLDNWKFIEKDAKIISMEEIIEIESSVINLLDMPKGVYAEKNLDDEKWEFFKLKE